MLNNNSNISPSHNSVYFDLYTVVIYDIAARKVTKGQAKPPAKQEAPICTEQS